MQLTPSMPQAGVHAADTKHATSRYTAAATMNATRQAGQTIDVALIYTCKNVYRIGSVKVFSRKKRRSGVGFTKLFTTVINSIH